MKNVMLSKALLPFFQGGSDSSSHLIFVTESMSAPLTCSLLQ